MKKVSDILLKALLQIKDLADSCGNQTEGDEKLNNKTTREGLRKSNADKHRKGTKEIENES